MEYIKLLDDLTTIPYDDKALLRDNRNVSFPSVISGEIRASYGMFPISLTPVPTYDITTETVVRGQPELVDGLWVRLWSIVPHTEQDRFSQEDSVRAQRDELLANTDWTALVDGTLSTDMATYRQGLRDVPEQEGFPYAVTWPSKP